MSYIKINKQDKKVELDANAYITMDTKVYNEMMSYVMHYKTEVSGCGLVKQIMHEDNEIEYNVYELFLPMQDNTGASTDIDEKEVHNLLTELISDNKETQDLRFHWHSHANMDVFHSGTDEENYSDLLNPAFLISIVANRDGDILGRIDIKVPFKLTISGVEVYVTDEVDEVLQDKIDSNLVALDKHIKDNPRSVITYHKNSRNVHGYGYGSDAYDDDMYGTNFGSANHGRGALDTSGVVGIDDDYDVIRKQALKTGYNEARTGRCISKREFNGLDKNDIEIVESCIIEEPEACWQCPKECACETYWEYTGSRRYQDREDMVKL